jgi:hypothetical protein
MTERSTVTSSNAESFLTAASITNPVPSTWEDVRPHLVSVIRSTAFLMGDKTVPPAGASPPADRVPGGGAMAPRGRTGRG